MLRHALRRFAARRPLLLVALLLSVTSLLLIGVAAAAPITVVDDNGADDEPGQKDLNSLSVDYNPGSAFDIAITWHWDDTAWSGQNSGDAQALFDTDGDGNANFTLAVKVSGTPAQYAHTRLYRCADSRSDRCQSPNELVAEDTNGDGTLDSPVSKASTGAASVVANSDPFGVASLPSTPLLTQMATTALRRRVA